MTKYLLSIIFVAFASVAIPQASSMHASQMLELIDNNDGAHPVVTTNESTVHVSGGQGQTLLVYNIAGGAPVMKVRIDGPDKRYELNLPKGIYIVQVGKVVRKIVIR